METENAKSSSMEVARGTEIDLEQNKNVSTRVENVLKM